MGDEILPRRIAPRISGRQQARETGRASFGAAGLQDQFLTRIVQEWLLELHLKVA